MNSRSVLPVKLFVTDLGTSGPGAFGWYFYYGVTAQGRARR
jgi:hypothetical protein